MYSRQDNRTGQDIYRTCPPANRRRATGQDRTQPLRGVLLSCPADATHFCQLQVTLADVFSSAVAGRAVHHFNDDLSVPVRDGIFGTGWLAAFGPARKDCFAVLFDGRADLLRCKTRVVKPKGYGTSSFTPTREAVHVIHEPRHWQRLLDSSANSPLVCSMIATLRKPIHCIREFFTLSLRHLGNSKRRVVMFATLSSLGVAPNEPKSQTKHDNDADHDLRGFGQFCGRLLRDMSDWLFRLELQTLPIAPGQKAMAGFVLWIDCHRFTTHFHQCNGD
ncbi:hypothetical protein SAMN05444002_0015 [Vannielia litorea]|uniref:Uncharacterized protein n=1 Tax=Vannielia litorea TaxID=1217970 RepID=A0A1N6DU97_9RHOB|nr:hypothetical protein SAMN05444002_0015 [Vannielia litorea]